MGDLCKYRNLDFHTYSQEIKIQLESFAKQNSLIEIDDCIERFINDVGIEGRQIII